MKKDVKTISPDISAQEALDLLLKAKVSDLPVIDKEGRLVGVFSETNILSYITPSYLQRVGSFMYEENPKAVRKKFAELTQLKVDQLMSKNPARITQDATLCEVVKIIMIEKAYHIPVVDTSGKVVGIVAPHDALKAFAKEAGTTIPE